MIFFGGEDFFECKLLLCMVFFGSEVDIVVFIGDYFWIDGLVVLGLIELQMGGMFVVIIVIGEVMMNVMIDFLVFVLFEFEVVFEG